MCDPTRTCESRSRGSCWPTDKLSSPPPNHLLSSFRAACGADAYGPERLPSSFTDVRPVSQQVHQRWRAWLAEGNDPVLDLRAFLGGAESTLSSRTYREPSG